MRSLLTILTIPILTFTAWADGKDMALFAGLIAGSTSLSYGAHYGRLPRELTDWKDATQTTSSLSKNCGILVETRLLKGNRQNFIFLGLSNSSDKNTSLHFDKMQFEFENGKVRFPDMTLRQGSYELKSGWYVWTLLPFPRKIDFKGQNSLVFKLPTSSNGDNTCLISSSHKRNKSLPQDRESYLEYTSFDLSIEAGASVFKSDKVKSVNNDVLGLFSMTVSSYLNINHGLIFSVLGDFNGDANSTEFNSTLQNPKVSQTSLSYGYVYRSLLKRNHYFYVSLAPSWTSLILSDDNSKNRERFSYFSVVNALSYDYTFSSVNRGFWRGDHAIGVTLFNNYIPSQSNKGFKYNGLRTSLLLKYRVGL